MAESTLPAAAPPSTAVASARRLAPGLVLASAVALAGVLLEPLLAAALKAASGGSHTLPAVVIALVLGIALHGVAARPAFGPGLTWCVKSLLRVAIALLGLRIALADIAALGLGAALIVVGSMGVTLASGLWFARRLGLGDGYGALAGAATAVCGASAALAAATVVPNHPRKGPDIAFTVVAANAVSTLVMVAYPPFCAALGLDPRATGILLGATIHDMAQVVGAGYAVSEPVGNTAVVVKLFRVLLLLPVVLALGAWFARRGEEGGSAKVPVPHFALAFLGLCLLNSLAPLGPAGLSALYEPVKVALVQASAWGLLLAIAALGLGTSLTGVLRIGWRHAAVFAGTTLVLLALVTGGLLLL